jgi:glycerol uptake facilitator-like aquaporin
MSVALSPPGSLTDVQARAGRRLFARDQPAGMHAPLRRHERASRRGHVGVAISFGLVIMIMVYAVGHISRAHFNPAVSFAFGLTRHFQAAAIAIGGTVGLDAMFGGPISGASMNPARSLGPALISGELHSANEAMIVRMLSCPTTTAISCASIFLAQRRSGIPA